MQEIAPIRIGARAVVIQDSQILLVKFDDENGRHYNYPGGGMRTGETAYTTVLREVQEETCAEVNVIRLLGVYEYLSPGKTGCVHELQKLELVFLCQLKEGSNARQPDQPDLNQVAVEWIPLASLEDRLVYPPIAGMIKDRLGHLDHPDPYLGNCYDFPLFT